MPSASGSPGGCNVRRATLLAVLALATVPSSTPRAEPAAGNGLQINVPNVILIDAGTRTVLFERGADDAVTPASTAKLMTSEYVLSLLKSGKLKRDQVFTVSQKAWKEGGAPSGGSTMFAKVRSEISVDDLLHGLIVDSANDAAITLAEGIAGSEDAFATRLNERARELGLTHLSFTNAWGNADPGERVTPREMALLADQIIEAYPEDYKIYAQREFLWNKIKQPNRNPLLAMDIGADGLKTGNIDESGYSIVGSAVQNGERLIVALYGAKSAAERLAETRKILEWGFRTFEHRKVFSAGDKVGTAQVYGGAARDVALTTPADITRAGAARRQREAHRQGRLHRPADGTRRGRQGVGTPAALSRRQGGLERAAADRGLGSGRLALQARARRRHGVRRPPVPEVRAALVKDVGRRGAFVTIEGGEGGGKSTQTRALVARLGAAGVRAEASREPGGSPAAEDIRAALLDGAFERLGSKTEALLFAAARIDHLDARIKPAMAAGIWIVCDRFQDSTRAYQGAHGGADMRFLRRLERVTLAGTRPDLTLILDLPAELGLDRAERRRGTAAVDRFEKQIARVSPGASRRLPRHRGRGAGALRHRRCRAVQGRCRAGDLGCRDA